MGRLANVIESADSGAEEGVPEPDVSEEREFAAVGGVRGEDEGV